MFSSEQRVYRVLGHIKMCCWKRVCTTQEVKPNFVSSLPDNPTAKSQREFRQHVRQDTRIQVRSSRVLSIVSTRVETQLHTLHSWSWSCIAEHWSRSWENKPQIQACLIHVTLPMRCCSNSSQSAYKRSTWLRRFQTPPTCLAHCSLFSAKLVPNNALNTGSNPPQPVSAHTCCRSDAAIRNHADKVTPIWIKICCLDSRHDMCAVYGTLGCECGELCEASRLPVNSLISKWHHELLVPWKPAHHVWTFCHLPFFGMTEPEKRQVDLLTMTSDL